MKKQQLFTALLILILTGTLTVACKKKNKLPEVVLAQYQVHVAALCQSIVHCIKEDVSERLKDSPRRKALVLKRMNRDLCLKGQIRLIGDLSTTVKKREAGTNNQLRIYKAYSECSQAVAAATDCKERRRLHKEFPACKTIRTDYQAL